MSDERQRMGRWGEDQASLLLCRNGIDVVERNWRCRLGELDIVGRDEDIVVFVEVRTRSSARYGSPEESITMQKSHRLRKLAMCYMASHGLQDTPYRIDVIAVVVAQKQPPWAIERIEHLVNVV